MADIDIFGEEPVKETPEPVNTTEPMVTSQTDIEEQPETKEEIKSNNETIVVPDEEKKQVIVDGGTIDDDVDASVSETVNKVEQKKAEVIPYVSDTDTVQVCY